MNAMLSRFVAFLAAPWRRPTPAQLVAHQLATAHLDLLDAEQQLDFWLSHTEMLRRRIGRLQLRKDPP